MFERLNFDSQNGMLKVNVYFDKLDDNTEGVAGKTAIFFRYYDSNNFYVLRLSESEKKEISLHKKVKGEYAELIRLPDVPVFKVWYTYYVVFYNNRIIIKR